MRNYYKKYFLKKKKCCRFFIIFIFLINALLVYLVINKAKDFGGKANPVLLSSNLQSKSNNDIEQNNYFIAYSVLNKGKNGNVYAFGELITKDTSILLNKELYLESDNTILDTFYFPSISEFENDIKVDYRLKIFLADSVGNLYIP